MTFNALHITTEQKSFITTTRNKKQEPIRIIQYFFTSPYDNQIINLHKLDMI